VVGALVGIIAVGTLLFRGLGFRKLELICGVACAAVATLLSLFILKSDWDAAHIVEQQFAVFRKSLWALYRREKGLFLGPSANSTAASFNSNGTALLDAAIRWARGGGSISASMVVSPVGLVNLTTGGVVDWAHWGLNGPTSFDHKGGVTQSISNFTKIGTGGLSWFTDCPTSFSWTDGTPTLSVSSTATGDNTNGSVGNGFEFTVPADTNVRTLKLYVGVWYTQGKLEASMIDGTAATFTDTALNNNGGASFGLYTINFKAGSTGQTMKIRFTILNQYFSSNGNVALEGATLQ